MGPFSLGGRSLEGNNVRGVFDELAIHDHGLTDEEIAAHIAALPQRPTARPFSGASAVPTAPAFVAAPVRRSIR